jgi:hypothetical protein
MNAVDGQEEFCPAAQLIFIRFDFVPWASFTAMSALLA